jgi:hypothetical protein
MSDKNNNESIGLEEALNEMKEAGDVPDGFHMMFFSEDFSLREECPTNKLLKSVGERFGFADLIRRQVFQLPKDQTVVTYEFPCFVGFDDIQQTMEEVDMLINESFDRMVKDGTLTSHPKARVQFLLGESRGETDGV